MQWGADCTTLKEVKQPLVNFKQIQIFATGQYFVQIFSRQYLHQFGDSTTNNRSQFNLMYSTNDYFLSMVLYFFLEQFKK